MKEVNSDKHLTYFKVEGFKNFTSLELNDIGLFNVIVGDNNVGKTNLLEALCFQENDFTEHLTILGDLTINRFNLRIDVPLSPNFTRNYFNRKTEEIIYNYTFLSKEKGSLIVTRIPKSLINNKGREEIQLENINTLTQETLENILEFSLNGSTKLLSSSYQEHRNYKASGVYIPYISSTLTYSEDLIRFYSEILSPSKTTKSQVINLLKIFNPNIDSIDLVKSDIYEGTEIGISLTNEDNFKFLSLFGDGFIKYFRILLEVLLLKNNRLMIDEIDNGIHYAKQAEYIKKIVLLAKEKHTQLFITTHSKECLKAIKEAFESDKLKEHQALFRNYSLVKNDAGDVKAFKYNFESFQSNINLNNELR